MASVFKIALLQKLLLLIFGASIASFVWFSLCTSTVKHNDQTHEKKQRSISVSTSRHIQDEDFRSRPIETKVDRLSITGSKLNSSEVKMVSPQDKNSSSLLFMNMTKLNHNVHIFYYPWYKNEQIDGKYTHWNHEVIPDWHNPAKSRRRQYVPPDDIGANFYPKLGPYSSHDPKVIEAHMQQMRFMRTGVVCVSWYPPTLVKEPETREDDLMMAIFDTAARYGLKVTFHIEPYDGRSGKTLLEVSRYIIDTYGNHSAFYRTNSGGRNLPVYYVYDSYQIPAESWAGALTTNGVYSVRNTKYDAIFLGLLVERSHFNHLSTSGFDGFYTYFAADGFTFGSSWINWHKIANEAIKRNLVFVPSIGPGYLDTRVRPWNSKNVRPRLNGKYYQKSFQNALSVRPRFLSITSYNEWHEGTQVEPAIPKTFKDFKYLDYSPYSPEYYLNLTRQFVDEYTTRRTNECSLSLAIPTALGLLTLWYVGGRCNTQETSLCERDNRSLFGVNFHAMMTTVAVLAYAVCKNHH